jgi:hypothetical protein
MPVGESEAPRGEHQIVRPVRVVHGVMRAAKIRFKQCSQPCQLYSPMLELEMKLRDCFTEPYFEKGKSIRVKSRETEICECLLTAGTV